jgi:hypothetical protein
MEKSINSTIDSSKNSEEVFGKFYKVAYNYGETVIKNPKVEETLRDFPAYNDELIKDKTKLLLQGKITQKEYEECLQKEMNDNFRKLLPPQEISNDDEQSDSEEEIIDERHKYTKIKGHVNDVIVDNLYDYFVELNRVTKRNRKQLKRDPFTTIKNSYEYRII